MASVEGLFKDATITPDITKLIEVNGTDQPVSLYKVSFGLSHFYFECERVFREDGNDFDVTIGNFGLLKTSSAGSKGPWFRREFTLDEVAYAKTVIEFYFFGGGGRNDFPFRRNNSRCLSVQYKEDWIVQK